MIECIKHEYNEEGISIDAQARRVYKHVQRQLHSEGRGECELFGTHYTFIMIDDFFGCECCINGEYAYDLTHCSELFDLIADEMDAHC